ncbi:MAG TPA: mercury transporter MerT [Gammaproteobacteria bacterium]|nr:mercury transporter MerT [Gammaproteobacteria bacterium]
MAVNTMSEGALPLGNQVEVPAGIKNPGERKKNLMAAGGVLGALTASSCCILPLVLFSLGIGGAWIGNLTALYPYKPYFVTITLIFLASGFYLTYRKPNVACEPGSYCATPASGRILKISLWGATALVIAALIFPYVAPYLLD